MSIYIFDTSGAYTSLTGFDEDYGEPNVSEAEAYRVLVRKMAPPPLEKYKKMRVKPYIESRRTKPNADFASSRPLILSQRAVDSLGPALKECGILYSGLNLNQDKATKPQTVQIVRNSVDRKSVV